MNETVTFWAELWRPMEKNSHGESLISPKFDTQPECVSWVRARIGDYEQRAMYRRVARDGTYEDELLLAEDAPPVDVERLRVIVEQLKLKLLA